MDVTKEAVREKDVFERLFLLCTLKKTRKYFIVIRGLPERVDNDSIEVSAGVRLEADTGDDEYL